MGLNTDHLLNCIVTLDASLKHLKEAQPESIEETLGLLPPFLEDARTLQKVLQTKLGLKDA